MNLSIFKILLENENLTFYHGTNLDLRPGDLLKPPTDTNNISEKGRKKNLNKVFFTLDQNSAKIYAGRAVQALGGNPHIYIIEPIGDPEWVNKTKGTTVLMAPYARIISKLF